MFASERLRHAAIAIGLAAMVGVLTLLRPVDITVWSLQAKLFDRPPSLDIVFVEFGAVPGSSGRSAENRELLRSIRHLRDAGVERIFLDLPVRRSNSPALDRELREELVRSAGEIVLTRAAGEDLVASGPPRGNDPFFEQGTSIVSNDYPTDFLGFVWEIEPSYSEGTVELPAMWTVLGATSGPRGALALDYSIDLGLVPRYELDRLEAAPGGDGVLAGKTAVVGPAGTDARIVKFPGYAFGPSSLVHILAAETALRGTGQKLSWFWMVGAFGLSLVAGLMVFRRSTPRRIFYLLWLALLPAVAVATAHFGVRGLFGETLVLALVYALLRSTVNFKRRHLFVESRSKLPNFVALQRDFGEYPREQTSIVVAKIARLDAVFATLNPSDQARYLRQLASRLALGDTRSTIYYDGGKYFAFFVNSGEFQDIQEHLEGLRAVASQSITVSQRVLDVSMTIGVDESSEKSISSRLSAAIAAADQAREAYRPVFIISDFAADSEEWDYSLQARLESALSEDRISIKLQPQADLRDGRIVGAEALARWVDEERGDVPPSRFILQCERVGRLDELTKRILSKSLDAAAALQTCDHHPRISVNVSAIQFVDSRIAELVEKNLAIHSADPAKLTIEVTETARIENFSVARGVFEQIKQLGVNFSMDDFGVASANLEAMFELPFDEIKIDQIFVRGVHHSETARAIVANVVRLARDAGLTSVAEGIEDRETYDFLRETGCDLGQGYYISRPMTLSNLQEMMTLQKDTPLLRDKYG
ncbi:EAL domain-containing protein [Pelagerythrobacter rhizovicinus]|uniref:EAL domain-containing protein n=1 Tax=Pelagerythrobacter rhizovicinus TaxID=2268576 RepID=A0A4Q2KM14_9SPHN|nr:EAL domain-containing protein [Pelagerythrobacter rhizovicinus]RXZ66368.1 EAL domain-containing protein [Pelagerythrobacter rhizovicinus]